MRFIDAETFGEVTFELREHKSGKWDLCILADGEKTWKIRHLDFDEVIKQLNMVMSYRLRLKGSKNG
jgi:hypothetical protein